MTGLLYLAVKALTFFVPIVVVWFFVLAILGPPDRQAPFATGEGLIAIIGGLGLGWCVNKWFTVPRWHQFCRYWARVCYCRIWRKELLPFLKQTRLPYGDFLDLLREAERDEIHCSGWINFYCRLDYGLAFVGLAQRYIF
ncbi:MAG: hypothetical protein B7Z55_03495 [Planctomycetales bacterium 12-60-4]|nr:MAG: hypothetical protein B7Z55_03495 [Planctomycetales bacterium 12-60-4]